MKKRVIAAATAAVLAALGVLALVVWANAADERAYEGAQRESVLQVTKPVPAGKAVSELASSIETSKLPVDAIPDGAVRDLADVAGLTTTTRLEPGEVLLKSRLGQPGEKAGAPSAVPAGYQEISVLVDPQHGVGGAVKTGDHVGLIATFAEPVKATNFVLQKVLVTKAERAVNPEENLTGLMVTLAVETGGAERVAHAAEWGKVWLTLQNDETDTGGAARIETKDALK